MAATPEEDVEELRRRLRNKEKIIEVLMRRVERSVDDVGSAYALFESNITLQERVAERTRALEKANLELRSTAQAAEAANRAKSEFLANMSHELRTPLNGVTGMISLLSETTLGSEQRVYLDTMRDSADVLLALIDDILDFSRLEAGRLPLESAPLDLRELLDDVADLLSVRAAEKGVELVVRWAAGTPRAVLGDAGRIRQVVMNLAANALKFTSAGFVAIRASGVLEGGDARLAITIEDSGIGIPEDKLGLIFDKFTQADASTTRRFGGAGLGLAISRQLAAAMGGSLSAESRVGAGSRFTFALRLPLAPERRERVLGAAGARILLAGPESETRAALAETLEQWGCDLAVVVPDDLEAALEGARAWPHEAIIAVDLATSLAEGWAQRLSEVGVLGIWLVSPRRPGKRAVGGDPKRTLGAPVRERELAKVFAPWVEAERPGAADEGAAGEALPGQQRFEGARILVAEDNPVNQIVARAMLGRLGCLVEVASNGREAVELFASRSWDLVFLDCHMPEVDGYQAVAEMRALEAGRRRTPILAMTASAMRGDRERALAAGMDDHLTKPVRIESVRGALQRWLVMASAEG